MRSAWMLACCLLVAVSSSWQSSAFSSWIQILRPDERATRTIQQQHQGRGTLWITRLQAATSNNKPPTPPPKPPSGYSGFSFVEGDSDDYVDVRDEIEAMGGDPFFLDDSEEEEKEKSSAPDPDFWQGDGLVDDDAHLDLDDDSHLDLQ